jgi:hypothetical protein
MEPKPREQYNVATSGNVDPPVSQRSVTIVLAVEWAQAVTRLQQLHNEGCTLYRLVEDDRGRVRIEPE